MTLNLSKHGACLIGYIQCALAHFLHPFFLVPCAHKIIGSEPIRTHSPLQESPGGERPFSPLCFWLQMLYSFGLMKDRGAGVGQ